MENKILIKHIESALNLSEKQIREKFAEYPICLMEYIEREINVKSIEIRFDKIEATLTCAFDDQGVCNQVFLFPDNNKMINHFISHFEQVYKYDYIKNKWITSDYSIRVEPIVRFTSDYRLLFQK